MMPDVNALPPHLKAAIPSAPVSAVVLDYGNVLYAWEPMAAVAGYVSADDWEEFVVDGGFLTWNERLDRGEPFEQVLADYTRAHPGRPDWAEILSLYRQRFAESLTGPVPGMAALLDDLLGRGVALYGLTNFDAPCSSMTRRSTSRRLDTWECAPTTSPVWDGCAPSSSHWACSPRRTGIEPRTG